MNDFEGLLSSDYGFKPQGKSAPMASSKPSKSSLNSNIPFNFDISVTKSTSSSPIFDDHDTLPLSSRKSSPNDFANLGHRNDVFSGGRSKSTGANHSSSSVNFDNIFAARGGDSGSSVSSLPVFDKPVYDDEDSSSAKYEDIFPSSSSSAPKRGDAFDDLLGGFTKKETIGARSKRAEKGTPNFDELMTGFGSGSTVASTNWNSSNATKKTSHVPNDPFVVLESTSTPAPSSSAVFNDPLEEIGNANNSDKKKVENYASRGVFDEMDPLDGFAKSVPSFSLDMNGKKKDGSPLSTRPRAFERQTLSNGYESQKSSVRSPGRGSYKKMPVDDYRESPQSVFEMPSVSGDSRRSVQNASSPAYRSSGFRESNSSGLASSDERIAPSDEIWLTVSEIPLFTQPTSAPPPSRPPPPRPARFFKADSHSFPASNAQKKSNGYSSSGGSMPYFQSPKSESAGTRGSFVSPIDELEDFSTGRSHNNVDGSSYIPTGEDFETNSVAAAAMRETMDKAEAQFKQARGAKEREGVRASRSQEAAQVEKEEKTLQDSQERKFKEHQERLEHERRQREREEEERRRREEEERRGREEEEGRRVVREQEEKEREKRRIERERELARQAVDRATREARDRAAAEARTRAERTVVQKAQAEARQRAERAAVQRVQAEARERAAAGAKERAEKAAADAKERIRAEVREKEVRERAAASASQQKNENDLESFFSTGPRASSAPRPRTNSSDTSTQFQSKPAAEATRTPFYSSSNIRKASSSANIVDDLSSIFGGPPSSGEFQDVEGESEERRRARLERHQRTQERAAKALAEKNARDLEGQREQAERHRIAETLDLEIKRWAAGKEGNLRALLSTLHYVLWPECGWQPVSLTDLITGAAVKKFYRKATLCIHPDKVQQKGATLQQKYIAEKVFDLLKESWNKFNSEELF